ncbi:MAG: hypothetical protein JXA03_03595 [Bacteroidales bacterium]|nr:hypothetical protein [Bacteroidales bacterium]
MSGNIIEYIKNIVFLAALVTPGSALCQQVFTKGEISNVVICEKDTTESYSLFLPSGYDESLAWPVVFIFEPGARALVPVEKYSALANEFGYILVCSYNARNGPWEPVIKAFNALYEDTYQRFSLDLNRLIAMGFSGGARAAGMMAIASGRIYTVIACGAGYPASLRPTPGNDFYWTGIVGWKDMNYIEMLDIDSVLCDQPNGNQLLFYDGYHEWPPEEIVRDAFLLLEANAMRDGLIPKDTGLIRDIHSNLRNESYYPECALKDTFLENQFNKKKRNYLKGLAEENDDNQADFSLLYLSDAEISSSQTEMITYSEKRLRDIYETAITDISLTSLNPGHPVKSVRWWRKENDYLKKHIQSENCDALKNMYVRLHEYIWRNAWEQHYVFMKQGKYFTAAKFMEVCEALLPEESWPLVRLSIACINLGQRGKALEKLGEAADKGYDDIRYFDRVEEFNSLKADRKFNEIYEKIKSNASAGHSHK